MVDPSTWLALIAGIALATFFLRSLSLLSNDFSDDKFVSPRRLAIINNVPVGGRRRREAGVEVWPNIDIPALESKIEGLGGENPEEEEEWATDVVRGKMPEGRGKSLHEDTLLARFAQFDVNQSANVNQQLGENSESQVDTSLSLLGGMVRQVVRWTREEDWRSSEKTMSSDGEEGEESCLVSAWRCMSAVLEQGVSCFQRPRGFQRWVKIRSMAPM